MQQTYPVSPLAIVSSLARNRALLRQMIIRDISSKYRGASLGLIWSIITPLLLLAVYTFVFTVIFKARWQDADANSGNHTGSFALFVFLGLICFNFFAECINRAPGLLIGNVNLIKKVLFPIEIFPFIVAGSALFHFFINFFIFCLAYLFVFGLPPLSILWIPLILAPYVMLICGLVWFVSSLGVFLRDIGQIIQLVTTVLMFLSPIFYPVSALPDRFQSFMHLNPLTFVIESLRGCLFHSQPVDIFSYLLYCLFSFACFLLGYAWFQKTRRLFADVI